MGQLVSQQLMMRRSAVSSAGRFTRRWVSLIGAVGLLAGGLAACSGRVVGQVELLTFDKEGKLLRYNRADAPMGTRPMIPA
jgi:hypothetical protein